jgi:hypothetical protein
VALGPTACRSPKQEISRSDPVHVTFRGVIGPETSRLNRGQQLSLDHGAFGKCAVSRAKWRVCGTANLFQRNCRERQRLFHMGVFDFTAEAELFPSPARASRRQPVGYKRFDRAADAVRFAVEELPPESLVGACLEVDEARFNGQDIQRLYESIDYPLPRRPACAPATHEPAQDTTRASNLPAQPSSRRTIRVRP